MCPFVVEMWRGFARKARVAKLGPGCAKAVCLVWQLFPFVVDMHRRHGCCPICIDVAGGKCQVRNGVPHKRLALTI